MSTRQLNNYQKPNIILVTCHDLGRWTDAYGRPPIGTKNLDRLASEGILFSNHFCTCPSCSPSRGSIVTGRYPHSNGLVGLIQVGWNLPETELNLPRVLNKAGYETILFGVQHEHIDSAKLGYSRIISDKRKAIDVMDDAAKELANLKETPFFMSIGTSEPHRPFHSDDMEPEKDVPVPPYLPDSEDMRKNMAGFRKLVRNLDNGIGKLMSALDANGLTENTWLIFTTDHGIDMPRAKGTLYDPGIETALIMRRPGVIKPGGICNQLLSNVDLFPTIMEELGIDIPENVQGKSYASILHGQDYEIRQEIFAEKTHHAVIDPMRCIRTKSHKLIDNFMPMSIHEFPCRVEMDIRRLMPELYSTRIPRFELYDLENDPLEKNNLSGKQEYDEIEKELKQRLVQWQKETDDFLLKGLIPLPK